MSIVYIGIGSNLGNREENCEKAIDLLTKKGMKIIKRSSLYETEPWGIKNQPKFINMAIEVETHLEPEELLKTIKEIESDIGRTKGKCWGPRVIDLDILLYNNRILKTHELEIPHPGTYDRDFVLKPLAEITPDQVHPVVKKNIKELLSEILN